MLKSMPKPMLKPIPGKKFILGGKPASGGIPVLRKADQVPVAPPSRYQIIDVIQEGGMGIISRAWDTLLKMDVAIKTLRPEIAQDHEAMSRLKSEAALAMRLSHENIVRLYTMDVENGQVFLVMEYVRGHTLAVISRQMGPLSFPAVLDIAHACCAALTYAHANGVLHRDIKPDNVMVNESMQLKLLDFGTALKLIPGQKSGQYVEGSPGYMSPEEWQGRPLDCRTDVFSLAIMLCELLTGKRAFEGMTKEVSPSSGEAAGIETLPVPVVDVLRRGMAPEINARHRSVAAFYEAFEQAMKPFLGAA
jgi:serine/threonine-protein kinase